jgi:hypothetical protein
MTGLAASLVAHQAMPIVHDARSLSAVAKRPVIGIVTVFPSAAMRRMRRLYNVLFAGAAGGFVAAFAAMFAFVFFIGRVV